MKKDDECPLCREHEIIEELTKEVKRCETLRGWSSKLYPIGKLKAILGIENE